MAERPRSRKPETTRGVPMREQIVRLLQRHDYTPKKRTGLLQALGISDDATSEFNQALRELTREGLVVRLKKKGFALAQSADLVFGTISFTRSGAAFIKAQDSPRELFVPPRETGTALPGDKVLVRVNRRPPRGKTTQLAEASVIRIVERRKQRFVGLLVRRGRAYYVQPQQASIARDILVPDPGGAALNDRVLVEISEWDNPRVCPEGVIREVIGPMDDPSLDTLAVMRGYDLEPAFPEEVLRAAEQADIEPAMREGRRDLCKRFIITIDPATARDFDDAISLERVRGGLWRLGVHIADVSAFVPLNSALDREARRRATSVYFPDQVVPMLPEHLSNGVCSLNPKVDRLAFSVLLTLDDDAEVHRVSFAESVIRSAHRLTYEQALAGIEAAPGAALPETGLSARVVKLLQAAHRLAQRLRARRVADGALNLEMPEVRFVLDDVGHIDDVVPVAHDASHQLIEEFMILANQEVCRELSRRRIPHLHRVHEAPDPEKLAELEQTFLLAGLETGDLQHRDNLVRLLEAIREVPQSHAWNMAVLRAMKRAEYSTSGVGHYGLAKDYYDHFTSPIRRYPDLVVHRVLKAVLAGSSRLYTPDQLRELGEHCSEREQRATEAERELVALKQLRFFAAQLEEGNPRVYDAIVTNVSNFGIFVDLPRVQATGMIHVSQLGDDFYDFNPVRRELKGRRTREVFALGATLQVSIAKVDFEKGFLDFAPVPGSVNAKSSGPLWGSRGD